MLACRYRRDGALPQRTLAPGPPPRGAGAPRHPALPNHLIARRVSMPAVVNAAEATGRQAASERPVASLAVWAARKRTGVALPPAVAGACFDLFGLHSAKGQ